MLVTIHQPEHLPWLGFLHKASKADVLVLLDSVQFRKNYYQNRNRVRTSEGAAWVTVPVLTRGNSEQRIDEVRINTAGSPRWREKYWGTFEQAYRRSTFWDEYSDAIRTALYAETELLSELNIQLIETLFRAFDLKVRMVRASTIAVDGTRSDLLAAICKHLGATAYLSGVSGRDYLDVSLFRSAGIDVRFHEFHHPIYPQRFEPFLPAMSSVDLLLNHGPESGRMLRGVGVEVMSEVFT